MKTKLTILFTFVVLAALVSGCGKGAGYPSQSDLNAAAPSSSTGETAAAAEDTGSGKPGKPPKVTGKYGSKPTIATPKGDPPEKLVIKDLKTGTGKTAKSGDEVTVNYLGVTWDGGTEFDASFGKDPFKFALGEGAVIKGWDEGVEGMKVGGRRLLVIPPDLAYGETGQGASIPPNATLVFVVDLTKVS